MIKSEVPFVWCRCEPSRLSSVVAGQRSVICGEEKARTVSSTADKTALPTRLAENTTKKLKHRGKLLDEWSLTVMNEKPIWSRIITTHTIHYIRSCIVNAYAPKLIAFTA